MPETIIHAIESCTPEKATHFFQILDSQKRSKGQKWQTIDNLCVQPKTSGQSIAEWCIRYQLCTARDIQRKRVRIVQAYTHEKESFFQD
jgi:hypothetical protein